MSKEQQENVIEIKDLVKNIKCITENRIDYQKQYFQK